jgi:ABC-type dipeptide/oligopeptide/nickel transport system ATPase subunit
MTNQIRLALAQQAAVDRLSSVLSKGEVFALRAQPGMGRTTSEAWVSTYRLSQIPGQVINGV